MRSRQQAPAWTVLHVLYPTPAARLRLLTHDLASNLVFGDGRAFFADVPVQTSAGERLALEVALPRRAPQEPLRHWLQMGATAGLVDGLGRVETPLVLEPSRLPAGRVPPVYGRALAIGSARAVELLRVLGDADPARLLPGTVSAELAYTYRALIANARQRWAAMWEHAAWLEGLADRHGLPPGEGAAALSADIGALPASAHGYERLRGPLLAQAARLAARARREGNAAYAAPSTVRAVLVGRLAHAQVVRLCGPGREGLLRWEAALVRGLPARVESEVERVLPARP